MSALPIDQLLASFCEKTLPKSQWTHEAHIRVGLWHVMYYGPDKAVELLRARITSYNLACGVENTDASGYHETITRFYAWRIQQFLAAADRQRTIDDLADELIALLGDQQRPLQHYSRERLMSAEARRGWVEPDLLPLQPGRYRL